MTGSPELQSLKIALFTLVEDEEWEEDLGAWRHKAKPVGRKPQGNWDSHDASTIRYIYFLPQTTSDSGTDPNSEEFPELITCYWNKQAGRWIMLPSGGGPAMAFFRLDEDAGTTVLLQAIRGNGDPEEVVNWSGLVDNAVEGYLGLYAPVTHIEDNPDYQPDEELPDYDPREKISRTIWAFAQGACIPPPE